jgi:DNA-binding transcriptional ArsR family regulator
MNRELGGATAVCQEANAALRRGRKGGPSVAPLAGADSALVGMAVEFVFPALGGKVRDPLIGAAPTPQLADRRLNAGQLAVAELQRLATATSPLAGPALARAADCALACARLEQHFRVGPFRARELAVADPAVGEPEGLDGIIRETSASAETRADLIALLDATIDDTADLYTAKALHVDPTFALSPALGGADADVIADGLLIDFKASRDRSVIRSMDVYQLVGYALADLYDWYAIHSVGIHALRWRSRWTISLDDLLHRLSGAHRPVPEWRRRFSSVLEPDDAVLAILRHHGPPMIGQRGGGRQMRMRSRRGPGDQLTALGGKPGVLRSTRQPPSAASPNGPARSARPDGLRVRSPATPHKEQSTPVIDRIRHDIQKRLDQLLAEAEKLRHALAALDPRSSAAPARRPVPRKAPAPKPAPSSAAEPKPPATKSAPALRTSQPAARSPRRTAPGATKASVLAALAGGEAMTASQVAEKTGLARGTVSTTLSKLAKSGEVQKAERGYRLAPAGD